MRNSDEINPSEEIDIENIMTQIRERVQEKKETGIYSTEELDRIEFEKKGYLPGFQDDVDEHLSALNSIWNTTEDIRIISHRPIVGKFIVWTKKLLWKLTTPYTKLIFSKQIEFNSDVVRMLNSFAPQMRDHLRDLRDKTIDLNRDLNEKFENLILIYTDLVKKHNELFKKYEELWNYAFLQNEKINKLITNIEASRSNVPYPVKHEIPEKRELFDEKQYFNFENIHRGNRQEVKDKQKIFLPYFKNANDILDIGCGRGEFLEILKEEGISSSGIDINMEMISFCRDRGLNVQRADALSYLSSLDDNSLGGIFTSQVIEHLDGSTLLELIRLCHQKLKPGAYLIAETLNPLCLTIFSGPFYLDMSHTKPIHPQTASFILEMSGYKEVEIKYTNPYPVEKKLGTLEIYWWVKRFEEKLLDVLNDNINRLNELLYGYQDYAVIGKK